MRIKIKYQNQRRIYYGKNKDKVVQKQNERYIQFTEIPRLYSELENRLGTLEENLKQISQQMTQKTIKTFIDEIYYKGRNRTKSLTKLMFTILMIFGLWIY